MSGRFNGPMSGRGQFNDGRTNSRSGSKRRGGSGGPRDKSTRKGNQLREAVEIEITMMTSQLKTLNH